MRTFWLKFLAQLRTEESEESNSSRCSSSLRAPTAIPNICSNSGTFVSHSDQLRDIDPIISTVSPDPNRNDTTFVCSQSVNNAELSLPFKSATAEALLRSKGVLTSNIFAHPLTLPPAPSSPPAVSVPAIVPVPARALVPESVSIPIRTFPLIANSCQVPHTNSTFPSLLTSVQQHLTFDIPDLRAIDSEDTDSSCQTTPENLRHAPANTINQNRKLIIRFAILKPVFEYDID
ncbi:unnamed protein product [Thelazia callipaeda]|uniref:Uncharacterized protein n=1 Tax=Thelazia callipaeda TaxID=103827 RepID=A0A0N5DBN7_THECL|nr:unnamed protein product [Thelazia callipaeda]